MLSRGKVDHEKICGKSTVFRCVVDPTTFPDEAGNGDFTVILHGGIAAKAVANGIKLNSSDVLGVMTKNGSDISYSEMVHESPRYHYGAIAAGSGSDRSLIMFGGNRFDNLYNGQGRGETEAMYMSGMMTKDNLRNSYYAIATDVPFLSVVKLNGTQSQINVKVPSKDLDAQSQKLDAVPVSGSLAQVVIFVNHSSALSQNGGPANITASYEPLIICPWPGEGITCQKKKGN